MGRLGFNASQWLGLWAGNPTHQHGCVVVDVAVVIAAASAAVAAAAAAVGMNTNQPLASRNPKRC